MKHLVAPSVNVCVIRGNRALLSRRAHTGWMDGSLCLPGGHVEAGESPTGAIVREIQEELGVVVDPKDLEFCCVAVRNTKPTQYVAYEFVLRDKDYDYINAEPGKCSELIWAEIGALPMDVIDDFSQIINQGVIGGHSYLEIGF